MENKVRKNYPLEKLGKSKKKNQTLLTLATELDQLPEVGAHVLVNQIIVTVGYVEHHILMVNERLLMLGPPHLLLAPKLQHLPM